MFTWSAQRSSVNPRKPERSEGFVGVQRPVSLLVEKDARDGRYKGNAVETVTRRKWIWTDARDSGSETQRIRVRPAEAKTAAVVHHHGSVRERMDRRDEARVLEGYGWSGSESARRGSRKSEVVGDDELTVGRTLVWH